MTSFSSRASVACPRSFVRSLWRPHLTRLLSSWHSQTSTVLAWWSTRISAGNHGIGRSARWSTGVLSARSSTLPFASGQAMARVSPPRPRPRPRHPLPHPYLLLSRPPHHPSLTHTHTYTRAHAPRHRRGPATVLSVDSSGCTQRYSVRHGRHPPSQRVCRQKQGRRRRRSMPAHK